MVIPASLPNHNYRVSYTLNGILISIIVITVIVIIGITYNTYSTSRLTLNTHLNQRQQLTCLCYNLLKRQPDKRDHNFLRSGSNSHSRKIVHLPVGFGFEFGLPPIITFPAIRRLDLVRSEWRMKAGVPGGNHHLFPCHWKCSQMPLRRI